MTRLLEKYANNSDYIFAFGTMTKQNAAAESMLNPEYNIVSSHEYAIVGYNSQTKTVKIINPHDASTETEIPVTELIKYVPQIYIASLK